MKPNSLDREGRSRLHYVPVDVPVEGQVAAARRLLADGWDLNGKDRRGWTPLHAAADHHAVDFAKELLEAGAEVDPVDAHGNTPLSKAVFQSRGRGEMIELLRRHGADPRAQNNHGVSPLSLARTIDNYDVRQFFADLPEDSERGAP